ncbi:flagellin [Neptuniibacter sp. 1_MG-2023]|uniref:flagellin n=1 Tax=Neptuniibacter sp. 1_MG-2023 TaxID=3062662 RepID=UPI0026E39151|nr:flagellin [Neptuniibacter sp. 1_MG-2023]MDO6593948.1 flagellin [Neptuniibacter sp. 1_MG-2023]
MAITVTGASAGSLNQFNQIQTRVNQYDQQLASGKRINESAVDPAGLQVFLQLQGQELGNNTAIKNSLDGISALQIAEGSVNQVNDSLQQIRELSVQAQNGTLNSNDKASLQKQADALLEGIKDSLSQSSFNGQSLLSQDGELKLQTGPGSENSQNITTYNLADTLDELGLFSIDITESAALDQLDNAQDFLTTVSSEIGANQNRLDSTINQLAETSLNSAEAASRIGDTDYAKALSERSAALVQQEVGIAMQAQANANRGLVLNLLAS